MTVPKDDPAGEPQNRPPPGTDGTSDGQPSTARTEVSPAEPDPAEDLGGDGAPTVEAESPPPPANPARKIILTVIAVLVVLYFYQVVADRVTPYTSAATVDTLLVQIAPEVTGQVVQVGVIDNGVVKKGQMLFRIDPRPFEIGLSAAEANLAVALQAADVSSSDIAVARAALRKQRVDLGANRQLGKIITDLVDKRALPQTNAIRARAEVAKTQADVVRAEEELERARRNLGAPGNGNPKVRQALAALRQAQLDLDRTTIFAPADGVVTNLRLSAGQFVNRGQPLLSFIENGPRWISAAMRENQLGNLGAGDKVLVALDDSPGRVFEGRIESIGWGITQGGESPTGQLPDVQPPSGWLRQPQRFPVRIILTPQDGSGPTLAAGRSGAQANVIAFTDQHSLLNPIGSLWIRIVAFLSYLQ